ncbi:MAG: UvrD-helicase domain-containing protein [Alphaproteobacteria bacterium]|nr:UvrD-helicase domain-containing protein [Alphaproteobacteria bacterium]
MIKKSQLSSEQEIAAEPTHNVWVQANAGTGKTSVLTERLLRILFRSEDKTGGILCLTYTNAAAGEMRNRILAALRGWAMATDDELRELLRDITENTIPTDDDIKHARKIFFEYIDNPDILKIKTIHGFCEEILRRFPTEAGITPAWSLISDAPQQVLLNETLERMVNSATLDTNTKNAFEHIFNTISEYKLDDLLKYIESQYKHFFRVNDFVKYRKYFIDTIKKKLNISNTKEWFFAPESMKNILQLAVAEKKPTKALINIVNLISQYFDNTIDFEQYKLGYLTSTGNIKPGLNYQYLEAEKNRVHDYNTYAVNKKIYDDTIALFDISAAFAKAYQDMKQSYGVLDFEDLILYTHRLFSNPKTMGWVLSQMDVSLSHILLDEAQDTGPLQWEILQMLAGDFFSEGDRTDLPRSLFVVGDTKQSIYGFQGADPKAFAESRNKIASFIQNNARQFSDTPLTQSFRSTEPILKTVDMFFGNEIVRSKTGFINNNHKCFRIGQKGNVEIYKLVSAADETTIVARRQYIKEIADKIETMIKSGRYLPRDIMILVQQRNPLAMPMTNELKRRGIMVAGSDRIVLPNFPVIKDLMNLLRFCINNYDDYSLGCVLKSPMFALTDDAIYKICMARNTKNARRRSNLDQGTPIQNVPLFDFVKVMYPEIYNILTDFINRYSVTGPYTFFTYVLDNYGIREGMIAALGNQIIDPLEEFLTICLAYERTRPGALKHFLKWFITSASEIKRDMDSGDGVRIVTVHGSKGLQSKVVFLIDTTSLPKVDNFYAIQSTPDNEYPTWLWTAHKSNETSPELDEVQSCANRKATEENFRLLYVAMTRACDEVYIYGFTPNTSAPEMSWHGLLWHVLSTCPGVTVSDDKLRVTNYDE